MPPLAAIPKEGTAMIGRNAYRRIGASEAQALLERGGVLVLDVRDAASFERGHMEAAHHVTMSALSDVIEGTPKAKPILIYCYHGNASQEYARILTDFRFQEVYSLDGGYEGWTGSTPGAAGAGRLIAAGVIHSKVRRDA
jgi:rhodanese-related sulfurtransferase